VVVVTGGLGRLGQQFSRELVTRGARVAIVDIADDPDLLSKDLEDAVGAGTAMVIGGDITDRESLSAALERISGEWGPPHGLVNNAALDSPPDAPLEENGPFESYPIDSWERVMDVNVKGTFIACQIFGGAMAEAGPGAVIDVASIYGVVAPNQQLYEYRRKDGDEFFKPVAYSASKSAVLNLTRYLATYWADKGVRVNTVSFGGVFAGQDERFLAEYESRVPLQRMANEDEYNGAIVFLLSDAASYMTGGNLVIDGGWTAW